MKNLSQELLEMTPAVYEKMVINHYHQWCHHHSWNDADCQKLLTSPALFNWWYAQYQKMEFKFAKRAIDFFGKASKQLIRDYHTEHVIKITRIYSRSLMKAARQQQPITPQYN